MHSPPVIQSRSMHAQAMLAAHPEGAGAGDHLLARCAEAAIDCAQTCTRCADACLAEERVQDLRQCIRLDLDCADLCTASAGLAARRTGANPDVLRTALLACAEACRACAEECERHADMHEHCRICAEACRACEAACREAATAVR